MRTSIAAVLLLVSTSLAAQTADVRLLSQTSRPTLLEPGDFGAITLAIQNLGPDVARNLRVEYSASPGVVFRDIQPHCTASAPHAMVCTYGDFAPGVTYGGTEYDMPYAAGTFTVTATVRTDSTDPVPGNDSATLTYQVVQAVGVFVLPFAPPDLRIDPGQTAVIRTAVLRTPRPKKVDTIPAGTVVEAKLAVTNGATIESITGPAYWSCTTAGATATCRAIAPGGECCGELEVTVRAAQDRAGGVVKLTAEAVVQRPSLDLPVRGDASFEVFRHVSVTNTQDAGPGSLRAGIEEVNEHCSTASCKLLFAIPPPVPAEGWFTITPATPLPPIRADRIFIDGRTQTALTGDTNPGGPEIVLDGSVAGKGPELHVACEGVLHDLTFRNFGETEGLWYTTRRACVSPNWRREFLISASRFERNRRGLILDGAPLPRLFANVIRENRFSGIWMWRGSAWMEWNAIEDNGASGIFLGPAVRNARVLNNTIRRNAQMGVAAAYGATHIELGHNRMRDNGGLGIDWGLDGVTPPREDDSNSETNAPTLLSAVYDAAADETRVTLSVRTRPMGTFTNGYVVIDLFANERPDGDGETPAGFAVAPRFDGTPFTLTVKGDHRGKWINATATRAVRIYIYSNSIRTNEFGDVTWTSELSNAVFVNPWRPSHRAVARDLGQHRLARTLADHHHQHRAQGLDELRDFGGGELLRLARDRFLGEGLDGHARDVRAEMHRELAGDDLADRLTHAVLPERRAVPPAIA